MSDEPAESRYDSVRKARQAVGIFHDRDRLQKTLDALASAGFGEEDLMLLGRPASQDLVDGSPWRLVDDDQEPTWSDQLGKTVIAAGNGDPDKTRSLNIAKLPPLHAAFLNRHLDAGSCLLWVTVHDGDQERKAGALLLEHTDLRVQLHDLF
ncbi:MAG: hypothetical protein AAGA21_24685 [Pseudomonadota bacterium]